MSLIVFILFKLKKQLISKKIKNDVIDLAKLAGQKIMEIYQQDFSIFEKKDRSPLTEADLISHQTITKKLSEITPSIPVLSEESTSEELLNRINWKTYWLIDPLDGTKEFIKKNGEFTVNIALIDSHTSVFGVVYAPAVNTTYYGGKEIGSFKQVGKKESIKIQTKKKVSGPMKIVGSRSHQSKDFKKFIQDYPNAEIIPMGSSLKICLVAEGEADLYPRIGPTSEWDTAAAQAILEGAGGKLENFKSGTTLGYNLNKNTLLNPFFLARG